MTYIIHKVGENSTTRSKTQYLTSEVYTRGIGRVSEFFILDPTLAAGYVPSNMRARRSSVRYESGAQV